MKFICAFNSLFVASLLFMIGSAIFTFEAILEIMNSISLLSLAHFLACLFFTAGSYIFMHNTKR